MAVSGQWSVVSDQWSVVSDQRSAVSRQWTVIGAKCGVSVLGSPCSLVVNVQPIRPRSRLVLRPVTSLRNARAVSHAQSPPGDSDQHGGR